jgi:hypothetical protein
MKSLGRHSGGPLGRLDLQGARNMGRKRHVSCELILQHIGRVHFNNLRHFAYHIHFPNGASYKIRYDWVSKESDYLRFHPELARLDCDFSVSPHQLICKIQGGVTKTGNQRIFIAKPMISVMRRRLTRWEQCGNVCFDFASATLCGLTFAAAGYGHKGLELKKLAILRSVALTDMSGITDEERLEVAAREGLVRLEDAATPDSHKVWARDWEYFGIYFITPEEANRRQTLRPRQ